MALIKYFLDHNIKISLRCFDKQKYSFRASSPALFDVFYKATIKFHFQETISPLKLFQADKQGGDLLTHSVLFITHEVDPQILELTVESLGSGLSVAVVINQSYAVPNDQIKRGAYINSIVERGGSVFPVKSPYTIKEDLE